MHCIHEFLMYAAPMITPIREISTRSASVSDWIASAVPDGCHNRVITCVLGTFKDLSHLVQSCLSYLSCMSKDLARFTGHVNQFFHNKILRANKKSTLKVLIDLGFLTSFEDSHYIMLFRYIYDAQPIPTVVLLFKTLSCQPQLSAEWHCNVIIP